MKFLNGNAVSAVIDGGADVLMHCCNCHNTFGSGIAKEIKLRIPSAYEADCGLHRIPDVKKDHSLLLGQFSCNMNDSVLVFNLYGQCDFGVYQRQINYAAFTKSLVSACETASMYSDKLVRVAIPYHIGCDRAGGDWEVVKEIICDVEDLFDNILFKVYQL